MPLRKFIQLPILAVTAVVLISVYLLSNFQAPAPQDNLFKSFLVKKGESATEIARNLKNAGLIKSPLIFKTVVVLKKTASKIEAGDYLLSPDQNLLEIIASIQKGPQDIWITLPEGLRKEEIANKLFQSFSSQANNQFNPDEFLEDSRTPNNLEGYLFPDTYLFSKSATSSAIIRKMTINFTKRTDPVFKDRSNGLSIYQTLILASLLEREVRTDLDKAIVAGIIIKRLKNRWPLDIDATLQYAKASNNCLSISCKWWPTLTSSDKNISSPFNTYKSPGLPPSPISNPGTNSIKAASFPRNSDYWFYLSDAKGATHFARSLEEHQANINTYLK